MAVLADPKTASLHIQALGEAARARGAELSIYRAARAEEILAAIDAAKASGAEAINILSSAYFWGNRQIIMQRVAALRLPAMYHSPEFAEEGGLLAYGPRAVQIFREIVAPQLIKLLRGGKPSDLPIQQPTKFELVVNLKTANALARQEIADVLAHEVRLNKGIVISVHDIAGGMGIPNRLSTITAPAPAKTLGVALTGPSFRSITSGKHTVSAALRAAIKNCVRATSSLACKGSKTVRKKPRCNNKDSNQKHVL
jgi:hypothetical protein